MRHAIAYLITIQLSVFGAVLFLGKANANSLSENKKIFSSINNEINYFEQRYGLAKNVFQKSNLRIYEIGDCEFKVFLHETRIIGIGLIKVSSNCNVVPEGYKIPITDLNVEGFNKGISVNYYGSCLKLCGNAAEPEFYIEIMEPHALNFLERRLTIEYNTSVVNFLEANEKDDNIVMNKVKMEKYREKISNIIKNEQIISYEEGYHISENRNVFAKKMKQQSDKGDGFATAVLATLYEEGTGVNKDKDVALKFYQLAIKSKKWRYKIDDWVFNRMEDLKNELKK